MGGKTKQSQRTKNNARPSSSGRSALLLSNVKLESGVMNVTGTELPALFPTLVAPTIDPLVSPELQMCIKKLNKKDPITKTKALQELSELVVNSEVDDVVAALPSWAHFYKILTADPERKVREATQMCHGAVVGACGRRLAPHLKQLMPAWLQAQYDEHAPAQTHAQNSLAKTFPDSKLPEVLSFCRSEVVAHLVASLAAGGDAAYIRKSDSAEERAAGAARAAASSLRGLQYVAEHLPRAHDAWLWDRLDDLLQANLFWKRAAHDDPRIRAAWHGAVARCVERFGATFAERHGARALRALAARDSHPLAAAPRWDCLLVFMYTVPDWHKYLEKKELFTKRILDLLESGGWGDAKHLSNMLLPLLAHLPECILNKEFYISFFDAIFNGLDKKTILSSKSERQAWITGLEECLRYLSTQQQEYVPEVVTGVHRTWLQRALAGAADGAARAHLIKHSAASMAALVRYWLKLAGEGSAAHDRLVRNFWQNVGATLTTQVDGLAPNPADVDKLIDGHILLLQTLKTSFVQETKKHHTITFDGDSPPAAEKVQKTLPSCDAATLDRYNHNLNETVETICGHYLEFAGARQVAAPVLSPLLTLLVEFESGALFAALARRLGAGAAHGLYERVLRGWAAGDTMRCKAVVDIVFLMLKHLSEEEQDAVFDTFNQFPPSVVEWCISLSLSHPHCALGAARRWLRGALVDATVAGVCARLTQHGDSNAKNLLLMCLNLDDKGETMISSRGVSAVLRQLGAAACDVASPHLEAAVGLAAALAATVAAPGLAALVPSLFRLSVLVPRGGPQLSVATWCEVRAAWQDGLQALAGERPRVLRDIAQVVHAHLALDSNLTQKQPQSQLPQSDKEINCESVDIKQIEHVVSLCPYVLSCSTQDMSEVEAFTRQIFDIRPVEPALVYKYALRHSIVRGELSCPLEDAATKAIVGDHARNKPDEAKREHVRKYASQAVFRAMYLRHVALHRVDEELADTWCGALLAHDYFVQELCRALHDHMVLRALADGYGFWEHYSIIREAKERMDTLIEDIVAECTPDAIVRVLSALSEHAATKGYYWSYAWIYFEILSENSSKARGNVTSDSQKEQSQNVTDDNQEKIENSKTVRESSKNETESSPNDTLSSPNDSETSPNEIETSPNEIESSQNETENSEQPEESQHQTENETEPGICDDLDMEKLNEMITGNGFFHSLQARDKLRPGRCLLRAAYLVMVRALAAQAHDAAARALLARDVAAGARACDADVVVNAYYRDNSIMLHETDVSAARWAAAASNAAALRYLARLVAARGWRLPPHHWDFAAIAACHALAALARSTPKWGCTKVAMFACAALELFVEVERFVAGVPRECERRQPAPHVAALPAEWRDIFAPDLHHSLLAFIMFVLGAARPTLTGNHIAVLEPLVAGARRVQWEAVPAHARAGPLALDALAAAAVAALAGTAHCATKCLAYHLLLAIQKPLVLEDAEKLSAWSAEGGSEEAERAAAAFSLRHYEAPYAAARDVVHAALAHVRVCEGTCALVAHSDVHAVCVGWLLLAECLHNQLQLARGDLAHHYMQIYRERKYAEPLLTACLRLLPAEVAAHALQPAAPPPPAHVEWFTRAPDPSVYDEVCAGAAARLACRGVARAAGGAGAGDARGWRGAAPPRHATFLDNIMEAYVSPHVVKQQLTQVHQRAAEVDDSEVTVLWSAFEVVCVLSVEERPIELRVQLSRSHPLGPPRLTVPESAPLASTGWLVMYLAYQNGSVLNALKMWVQAVTSKVERSPQCYICYCRLHHATGRLPATTCHQCRNRFHIACLRKWFATSNKSNCPLCRTSF